MDPGQTLSRITDGSQWRRIRQRAKARPPTTDPELDEDADMLTTVNHYGPESMASTDFAGAVPSSTDKDFPQNRMPTWPAEEQLPRSMAEDAMESIMCVLMAKLATPLDVRFNGMLLRIFESYLQLRDENTELQAQLSQETSRKVADRTRWKHTERAWMDEKEDYKEEIKRLEVLLSRTSSGGLADVMLARQNSKLRERQMNEKCRKETIFEVLERRGRREDRVWDNQRGTSKI